MILTCNDVDKRKQKKTLIGNVEKEEFISNLLI